MLMKKVISYSLWGDNPQYTHGAIHNANLITSTFPGWIMRVYYDNTVPTEVINTLKEAPNVELFLINKTQHLWEGLYWRFYVHDDPTVERYIVRDLDDRLSRNDKACVDEWVNSNIPFHLIRTVLSHNTEMMGGLWGVVRSKLDFNMVDEITKYNNNLPPNCKGPDQVFLKDKVWPLIKGKCLVHGLDFNYNSGIIKDFIYGENKRENYQGILLPAAAGCVFGHDIKTWEEGWEKDNRVNFNVKEWYNSIRK